MYPSDYKTGDEDDVIPWGYSPTPKPSYGNDVPPWDIDTSIFKSPKSNKHMGEMADWTLEQAMWDDPDWDDEGVDIRPKVPEGYWKQKDGTLIEIKKMTDSHLKNSIALCQRNGCHRLENILLDEQKRRVKTEDDNKMKQDPIYAAWSAGWNAGQKSAFEEVYPDVGPSFPQTKENAWKEYKKKQNSC